ncbi:MAG: hypothetical protein ABI605_11240 [Rhizobacter sp.]
MCPAPITRPLLAALLALASHAALAIDHAPVVELRVNPEHRLAPANPAVLRGYNFGNWMQVSEFTDALHQAPTAALRFPGGNVGDDEDMGGNKLDFFKLNLQLLGEPRPELLIQTRVFQSRNGDPAANGPQDAAQAVLLARERGLKVPVWEIGNEPDLFAVTRGDPSWTAERYCEVFRAQAAAIKREDPAALIAGPGVSGAMPAAPDFAKRFLKLCGDVVDVFTWHIYPTDGTGSEAEALASVSEATRWPAEYRRLLADPEANPLGHARHYELGVTEYGLSWRTERQRFIGEQSGALWAAEFALRSAESGLRLAHYFAYQGTGFHGLLDSGGAPRPTYYGFRLLAPLAGDFVEATSSDEQLWAHAVRDGQRLSIVLINSSEAPRRVRTGLAAWKLRGGRSFDARLVADEKKFARVRPGAFVTLPARSMAVLDYQLLSSH